MQRFITLGSNRCLYRSLKGPGGGFYTRFTEPLTYDPEMFAFWYYFPHPEFRGDSLEIKFNVDRNHRLMAGLVPEGLFDMRGITAFKVITRQEALAIAKKAKIKKPLKDYEITLGWEETKLNYTTYNTIKDIRDLVKGSIVWRVKSKYREAPSMDEDPHTETYIIGALTGKLIAVYNGLIGLY